MSQDHCDKEESGSFTIKGHKIQSIALDYNHNITVTMEGAIFAFGSNNKHQLGVVDQSALLADFTSTPIEVFAAITESKRAAILHDSSDSTWKSSVWSSFSIGFSF